MGGESVGLGTFFPQGEPMTETAIGQQRLEVSTNPATQDREGGNFRTLEEGYRIGLRVPGDEYLYLLIPPRADFRFAREIDASMAIAALQKEGLATMEAIEGAGWNRVRQVMLESLQW